MAVDPVILEFQAETKRLQEQINALDKKIEKLGGDSKKAGKQMDKAFRSAGKATKGVDGKVNKLNSSFDRLGKRIVAAFAVDRLARFTTESIKLASEMQGVEAAFKRIGSPELLRGLKEATRGTVSDLELMKKAVQANNFQIPLENLATLFDFARRRAKETGESVDFLVHSIVTGIGRKSPLILDNLGISAVRLRKELKGVGIQSNEVGEIAKVVGKIATEEMEKMGDEAVTTANRIGQINAKIQNFKVEVGNAFIPAIEDGIAALERFGLLFEQIAVEGFTIGEIDADMARSFQQLNQEADILVETLEKDLKRAVDEDVQGAIDKFSKAFLENIQLSKEFNKLSTEYQIKLEERISGEAGVAIEMRKQRRYTREMKETQDAIVASLKEQVAIPILPPLRERLKLIKEEIEGATSQVQINRLVEERERLETRINAILGQRKNLIEDGVDPELSIPDFPNIEDAQSQSLKRREEQFEEFYDNLLMMRAKAAKEEAEWDNFVAAIREQNFQRALQLGTDLFTSLTELAVAQAGQTKELAIFQALIGQASAIIQVFATAGVTPIEKFVLAATVAARVAAQVAEIQSTQIPSFFQGTPFFSDSPSKGRKRDDGFARLHYGEAVIPADENRKYRGLTEAMVKGKTSKWIYEHQVLPALVQQQKELQKKRSREFASNMAASLAYNMPDERIIRELKKGRRSQGELIQALMKSQRKNPYRA